MATHARATVTFRDLVGGLRSLDIAPDQPAIIHSSLSAFGEVHGGAETLLGAIFTSFNSVIAPAFTSRPEIIPEVGPENNAIDYGSGESANLLAEFFQPDMPVDKIMGIVPEIMRNQEGAARSNHPLLSFTGYHASPILESQTFDEPLAPIRVLAEQSGWVLMLGVDHTVNTSIHYAEKLGGRKQFLRWALTSQGVCECPGYPGCSDGFHEIAPHLERFTRRVMIGEAQVQAIALKDLIPIVTTLLAMNPLALLCNRPDCQRCNTIRKIAVASI